RSQRVPAPPRTVDHEQRPRDERGGEGRDDERAPREPAPPLRTCQYCPKALGTLQVTDEQRTRDRKKNERDQRRRANERMGAGAGAQVDVRAECSEKADTGGDPLCPDVGGHPPPPRPLARHIVRDAGALNRKGARGLRSRGRWWHELACVAGAAVGPHV